MVASACRQRARDDLARVAGKSRGGRDAGDRRSGGLPVRLGELRPAVERTRDLRRQLRVERIELEDPVGPYRVAGTVAAVEGPRVAETQRADHAARAVRVGDAERRMA